MSALVVVPRLPTIAAASATDCRATRHDPGQA